MEQRVDGSSKVTQGRLMLYCKQSSVTPLLRPVRHQSHNLDYSSERTLKLHRGVSQQASQVENV